MVAVREKEKSRTIGEHFLGCGRRDRRALSGRAAGFVKTPLLFTR